jgi:peptidoglycan/xylan/chitin deacetylase (PgdA/CDA1 family)
MPTTAGTAANHRIAVSLTFDFDAESAWLNPARGEPPAQLSRWLYGAYEGIPRILKLLDKYGLPATFFIPGATCDNHSDVVRSIAAAGHEIGHHGYYHEAPHVLSVEEERTMIEKGLDALQRIAGVTPRGYRSPSWELSKATFGLLAEYGFAYDASQLARDRPYWIEDQGQRRDLVEIPSAWELCDSSHFLFSFSPFYLAGLSAPSKVEEIWRDDFAGMYDEGGDVCYVLTMHPKIIGRPHRMRLLERTIQYILDHDDIWFAQMQEIADNFRRRQRPS